MAVYYEYLLGSTNLHFGDNVLAVEVHERKRDEFGRGLWHGLGLPDRDAANNHHATGQRGY